MFYYLIHLWSGYQNTPLRLIDYSTFRSGAALLTAFLLCIFFGPMTVRMLKNAIAPERLKGLVDEKFIDQQKSKTPSMGGLLIVFAIAVSTGLWSDFSNPLPAVFLGTLLTYSAIGFIDDFYKVFRKDRDGIRGRTKLILQFLSAGGALWAFHQISPETFTQFTVPFMKGALFVMPVWLAYLYGALVVVGASNAVNLTDGKDGLCTGCMIFCALAYGVFAYVTGHRVFAEYLDVNYIAGASEVVVLTAALIGACIGFLWFNCHPAAMFMGDTGSLALGGVIGLIAVLVKQELLLVIVGGVFVMEIVSVMLQVASFKLTGKRIFRCTPIHHHFEQGGWTETQIVTRFWILAGLLALIGMATLKIR
ncbi:MAG: phospho-N-acetylmuramoyl-pentapeptide-transferase [Lentisphaeria bacterium]|nr:phospho-N-acetylmuramoyl-pentapeptide-transferase [Lentisphaeria bacterium]MBO5802713.1 phospho-N-acetylmuramoyl-pentapeptide-transferase [Lentisphaeria bacterium]